jgi:hypothetical protein
MDNPSLIDNMLSESSENNILMVSSRKSESRAHHIINDGYLMAEGQDVLSSPTPKSCSSGDNAFHK